jgi:hypothetical protein
MGGERPMLLQLLNKKVQTLPHQAAKGRCKLGLANSPWGNRARSRFNIVQPCQHMRSLLAFIAINTLARDKAQKNKLLRVVAA